MSASPDQRATLDAELARRHAVMRKWAAADGPTLHAIARAEVRAAHRAQPDPYRREPHAVLNAAASILGLIVEAPSTLPMIGVDEMVEQTGAPRSTVKRATRLLRRLGLLLRPRRGTKGNGYSVWRLPQLLARRLHDRFKAARLGRSRDGYTRHRAAQHKPSQWLTRGQVVPTVVPPRAWEPADPPPDPVSASRLAEIRAEAYRLMGWNRR
jgi:hypothetical protein